MSATMEELFEAGCHLGHPAYKWHPKMKPWIYGEQDGIHLFDLAKTSVQLEKVDTYVRNLKRDGKTLVVVATKKQAAELAEKLALESGAMYIVNRWPGGLITNWDQVKKSIKRMNEIEEGLETGKFKEYTKYERLMMEKELARLERLFGGLKKLKGKPDALLIIDAQKEKNSVKEALKENIDIIALLDSNTDPTDITLPIPGNDDALSSITLILTQVLKAYGEGEKSKAKAQTEAEKPAVIVEEAAKEAKESSDAVEVETEKETPKIKKTVKNSSAKKKTAVVKAVSQEEKAKKKPETKKTVKAKKETPKTKKTKVVKKSPAKKKEA